MLRYLLGEDAKTYVESLDLPMSAVADLLILLNAAVLDLTPEEARKRFQQQGIIAV